MPDEYDWLKVAKVGDPVVIRDGFGYARYTASVISRATPARVSVNGSIFRREDGLLHGRDSRPLRLIKADHDSLKQVERQDAMEYLTRGVLWGAVPDNTLIEVAKIIRSATETKGTP